MCNERWDEGRDDENDDAEHHDDDDEDEDDDDDDDGYIDDGHDVEDDHMIHEKHTKFRAVVRRTQTSKWAQRCVRVVPCNI